MGYWEWTALAAFVLIIFVMPRWRRRRTNKKLDELDGFSRALPRIVTPARGPSVFGGEMSRPKLEE